MSVRLLGWLACLPFILAQLPSDPSSILSSALSTAESSSFYPSSSGLAVSATSVSSLSSASPTLSFSVFPSSVNVSATTVESTTLASSSSIPSSNVTSVLSSSAASPTTTTRNTVPIMSYTFSPYPSPTATGGVPTDPKAPPESGSNALPDFSAAWTAAFEKAKAMVATFTLEEKVNVTTGVGWQVGRCVGNIPPIGKGFPGLCLEDSPLGVRLADFVTAFPTGVNAAATFNRRLIRLRGLLMGREHVAKGVHVALGPMMNMGRIAQGGRNWEGFGADPFLTGEAAYETILGMQEAGVQACAKHLIGNEQEHRRTQESSDVDDRTLHEIYSHPFLRSVMAGVASMMCSYSAPSAERTYACENDKVMNDIIKREYGFQGYIMSDWQATESTISAITGLDMTMPGDVTFNSGDSYFGANLTAYVHNDTIPEARVDDMATRIIAACEATNEHIDVQEDHYKLVREIGAASTVLLKNTNDVLPLNKPRTLVLLGSDAGPSRFGPNPFGPDQGGNDGILAMGWGSGTATFPYLVSPLEAIQQRARKDHTTITWMLDDFNLARASSMATKQSAALVFINSDSGEGYITVDGNEGDRKNLTAWHGGDALVQAAAAQNNNTIVIVNSVGPLIVEPWIEHPNVSAVLWAGASGQEAGNAIADVLYGDWNPSARLPYTIAKRPEDYSAQLVTGGTGNDILDIPYTEGLYIDYRHFDAENITPRFEFGFGLSYTTFEYDTLSIERTGNVNDPMAAAWEAGEATEIFVGSGTAAWLHEDAFKVTFNVRNSGAVYGGEIPQLYLNMPASAEEPPSILEGFDNVELSPGESKEVTIFLSRYAVSIWDTVAQGWRRPEGTIGVTVGASSRDGRLFGSLP
ncbi:glycoside hydrolase family 3 protein [Hymenopellis radicata]|nr:glycoside hydrolase family 3 protein [Hymenopellis radicata]